MTSKKNIDPNLLERYAEALQEDNYPPVAGRIMGVFYLSEQKFFTFEELMELIEASKSATSKGLKFLIDLGEVNFKYIGKRRRQFYLDFQGTIDRVQRLIEAYQMQTNLMEETLKGRSDTNSELNNFIKNTINFQNDLLEFVETKLKEHYNH